MKDFYDKNKDILMQSRKKFNGNFIVNTSDFLYNWNIAGVTNMLCFVNLSETRWLNGGKYTKA